MLFGAFDALMDIGMVIGPSLCFTLLATSRWSINYSFIMMAIPSIIALGSIFRLKETKA
jgi:MFS family permease